MNYTYYVSKDGADSNHGSKEAPFLTISKAAMVARPGDTIIVHEGIYREWVKPEEGGLSNNRRITYEAAEGEKVIIKGSEEVRDWERVEGTVWKAVLPNTMFGDYNPFAKAMIGDWLIEPVGRSVHLGDVYLNGMSLYEAAAYEDLMNPVIRRETLDHWTKQITEVINPDQTKYLWYAKVEDDTTTIYANFHEADPNHELVEVNVRKCCFYPERTGINYITVRGFELAQAATPWSPPTADQPGLIGPNWSKGWIIENNIIHDSKCSGISIGKEASTGNNFFTFRKDKPGYQYQLESVFTARKYGWSKEKIGSHIIRNNTIYDCGQNGIVGHLGCVFSEIYHNHIYNIAIKREFYGHEIGGIKLHAAIDVTISHNYIHHCSLGTWLDWQAQGTRVSKNLYHDNNRDLFIEVSHGPFLVDHNIFGSAYSLDNHAQGSAYVKNLFAGKILLKKMLNRATPYHAPHSTDVTGYAMVYGADDRYYQNLFVGGYSDIPVGTYGYDGCTTSLEEYINEFETINRKEPGDLGIFETIEQPAYVSENVYIGDAKPFNREEDFQRNEDFDTAYSIEVSEAGVYLNITLPEGFEEFRHAPHCTDTLPRVRIVDADFENLDGSPVILDSDYLDTPIGGETVSGPIEVLKAGKNRIRVWG